MEILHILANLFLFNVVVAQIMSKCCPLNHELFIGGTNLSDIERENVFCRPTNGTVLVAVDSPSLTIGLPNCSKLNIIDVYRRDLKISCLDRITQLNDVYALRCAENETENSNEIVTTVSMRKCCPSHRAYNWDKQYCFSQYTQDNHDSATNLIKLAWNRTPHFVNLSFGSPVCRKSDVLIDKILHRDKVEFLNTDAIAIKELNSSVILSFDEFCVDLVDDRFEYLAIRSCQDYLTSCKHDNKVCVQKCCPVGYEYHEEKCIPSTRPLSLTFYNITQTYDSEAMPVTVKPAFLQASHCATGKYQLIDDDEPKKYLLTTSGTVYMPATNRVIDIDSYCVDNVKFHNKTRTFVCVHEEKSMFTVIRELKPLLTSICAAISAFFFILTFLIYLCLPSLRNLHGQLIMSYLFASAASYVMVVIHRTVQLRMYSDSICKTAGYTMLFVTLASFCWLNVISFDIWSTFRITRSTFLKKSKTCKKLILYNIYGWGYPLLWSIFASGSRYIFNIDENSPWNCDIGQVSFSCWFADYGRSKIIYFIVPISIMLVFNAIIFITIVKYCSSVKAELYSTNNCNYSLKKYSKNKNDFMINIKLFILMGLNWSLEIVALVVQPQHRVFFVISDLLNALVGLIVFCILIMKRKVLHNLKKTLCQGSQQQGLDRLTRSNASTSSSNLQSSTNLKRSSVHRF
ncbi:G-protein coupled receptor Mth2-like [Planococcus citri]|uniref:G-protein coupled receptor Mth2-like n=1 Tax=Planococcus citri TaxID=170843 RepID=UPI0031F76465